MADEFFYGVTLTGEKKRLCGIQHQKMKKIIQNEPINSS
ncbi:CLUMA_CG018976, isoform A [Clunio marinus]|uniref:CLUMA_CG018976, isoform A n=1 Tax=Clunio marinus TaxID=568069 RepID=A0A1J1J4Z5_9DIPT|nr:CLUMA_CG018976, isoform A [Clunio marinus]